MKRLTAISLLLLLLFNFCGYRLVIHSLQDKLDDDTEQTLDEGNYSDSELTLIEVPLSNPYQVSTADYERVNGEISFNGVIYKYVKRKITDGKMLLMCIPDHDKMQFIAKKMNLERESAGLETTGKNTDHTATSILKLMQSEFEQESDNELSAAMPLTAIYAPLYSEKAISQPCNLPDNPPDMA